MINNLLKYAEAKLLFRESIYKFSEGIGDENLHLTTLFGTPPLTGGEIYIYDYQIKIEGIRQSTNTAYTDALHRVYVKYCESFPSAKERAQLIAEKLDAHLLSLNGIVFYSDTTKIQFDEYTNRNRHFENNGLFLCDYFSYVITEK